MTVGTTLPTNPLNFIGREYSHKKEKRDETQSTFNSKRRIKLVFYYRKWKRIEMKVLKPHNSTLWLLRYVRLFAICICHFFLSSVHMRWSMRVSTWMASVLLSGDCGSVVEARGWGRRLGSGVSACITRCITRFETQTIRVYILIRIILLNFSTGNFLAEENLGRKGMDGSRKEKRKREMV